MVGRWINDVPGSLALVAQRGRWWRLPWRVASPIAARRRADRTDAGDETSRFNQFRYHLGRGRRAREVGRFERGAVEARRALALNGGDPWAHALLGQCLQRQRVGDLPGARRALERACALDPSNGYFVGLLLGVLNAQGDAEAARNLLTWAWWHGAPVERWLTDGPPLPAGERGAGDGAGTGQERRGAESSARRVAGNPGAGAVLTGARPMLA